jgi:hypothetical protein
MKKIYILVMLLTLFSCSTDEDPATLTRFNKEIQSNCDPCTLLKAEINATYDAQLSWYIENHPNPSAQDMIQLHMERMGYLESACEEPANDSDCDPCTLLKAEISATMNLQLKWYMENHPSPSAQDIIQQHQEKMGYLASACEET